MGLDSVQSGYLARCYVIMALCAADICINAVADHPLPSSPSFMPYVFFGVQLAIQIINILLIFMLFAGTYLFQVGLVGVQVREFRGLLACAVAYLGVYVAYGGYKISLLGRVGADGVWNVPAFIFLSIAQKITSLLYYLVMLVVCSRMGQTVWYSRAWCITALIGVFFALLLAARAHSLTHCAHMAH